MSASTSTSAAPPARLILPSLKRAQPSAPTVTLTTMTATASTTTVTRARSAAGSTACSSKSSSVQQPAQQSITGLSSSVSVQQEPNYTLSSGPSSERGTRTTTALQPSSSTTGSAVAPTSSSSITGTQTPARTPSTAPTTVTAPAPRTQAPQPQTRPTPDPQALHHARLYLTTTLSHIFSSSHLPSLATDLHANDKALRSQLRSLEQATEGLRRENDKLERLVGEYEGKLKEVGDAQWFAQVCWSGLERVAEVVRLVKEGEDGSDEEGSWSGSDGSWESDGEGDDQEEENKMQRERGDERGESSRLRDEEDGDTRMEDIDTGKRKGKAVDLPQETI